MFTIPEIIEIFESNRVPDDGRILDNSEMNGDIAYRNGYHDAIKVILEVMIKKHKENL